MFHLAGCVEMQSRRGDAKKLYHQTMEGRKRALGTEHAATKHAELAFCFVCYAAAGAVHGGATDSGACSS